MEVDEGDVGAGGGGGGGGKLGAKKLDEDKGTCLGRTKGGNSLICTVAGVSLPV